MDEKLNNKMINIRNNWVMKISDKSNHILFEEIIQILSFDDLDNFGKINYRLIVSISKTKMLRE